MAIFTILYGNYYPPDGEFELIYIGKFARRTWVDFTQQFPYKIISVHRPNRGFRINASLPVIPHVLSLDLSL